VFTKEGIIMLWFTVGTIVLGLVIGIVGPRLFGLLR